MDMLSIYLPQFGKAVEGLEERVHVAGGSLVLETHVASMSPRVPPDAGTYTYMYQQFIQDFEFGGPMLIKGIPPPGGLGACPSEDV